MQAPLLLLEICCHNLVEDKPTGQEQEGDSFSGYKKSILPYSLNNILKNSSLKAVAAHCWLGCMCMTEWWHMCLLKRLSILGPTQRMC